LLAPHFAFTPSFHVPNVWAVNVTVSGRRFVETALVTVFPVGSIRSRLRFADATDQSKTAWIVPTLSTAKGCVRYETPEASTDPVNTAVVAAAYVGLNHATVSSAAATRPTARRKASPS
jgi:hypothetical protein